MNALKRLCSLLLVALLLLWSAPLQAGFLYGGSIASDITCTACVSLTTEVSGILPEANGGTGLTSLFGTANSWTATQTFAAGALLGSNDTVAWGNAVGGGTADLVLGREAADVLQQVRGTNAQTWRLYKTFTDASNYERSVLGWSASRFYVATETAGTGADNIDIHIRPAGDGQVLIGPGGFAYATAASGAGSIILNNGTADTPGIKFATGANTNFGIDASGSLRFINNADEAGGAVIASLTTAGTFDAVALTEGGNAVPNVAQANVFTASQTFAAGALLGSDDTLAWGNAVGGGTADTILVRAAANTLALRNGTTAQGLYVYETFTDASNYALMALTSEPASDRFALSTAQAGTGAKRQLTLIGESLNFTTDLSAFTIKWKIPAAGAFLAGTDNAFDIGATGANRPRTIYAATSYELQGANAQAMGLKQLTELTTIDAAATTDTTIQIPANSLVLGVTVRVTTIIPTAATFDVGVAGATTRYGTGILVAAGTTNASPGTTNPTIYSAAVSIRITPNLTPGDTTGRVRVTIHYLDLTAPTS